MTTSPSVYLAGRYSRRRELCFYRTDLAHLGIDVTSRWLNGAHQVDEHGKPIGDDGEARIESGTDAAAARFGREDLADVAAADLLVAFTEKPRAPSTNRGGRHVEYGYALALGKPVIVVGYRENVFHWLADEYCESWPIALNVIRRRLAGGGAA